MSHFYSSIQGRRGEATHCNNKNGVRAVVQSFSGSVITKLFVGNDGEDWAEIQVAKGSARAGGKTLYRGPIARLLSVGRFVPSFLPPTF